MINETNIQLSSRSSVHIARKVWHCSTGVLGLWVFLTSNMPAQWWGQMLICAAMVGFLLELIRLKSPNINQAFCQIAGPLMRKSEYSAPTGFAFYALGVGMAIMLFDREVALLACSYLVFADPVAAFVGVKYGKTKIWNGRSIEGTLAFFGVALMTNLAFYHFGMFSEVSNFVLFSIITASSAALAEVVCNNKYLDDNLVIPVLAGLFITASKLLF